MRFFTLRVPAAEGGVAQWSSKNYYRNPYEKPRRVYPHPFEPGK